MTHSGPAGSHVLAVSHQTVREMVSTVVDALGHDGAAKLKVRSGEHLAAVLASAFLGTPPTSVDRDGGPDIEFDLSAAPPNRARAVIGCADVQYADFEVKSLPGPSREFDAAIDRARARGIEPTEQERSLTVQVVSVNNIVRASGEMIDKAAEQLRRKSSAARARNVFLIAHTFDHMYAEILDPVIAHHLDPLSDLPNEIDSVWLLLAETHLVIWWRAANRWTNLLFSGGPVPPAAEGDDVLIAVDEKFRHLIGDDQASPFAFTLTASDPAVGR